VPGGPEIATMPGHGSGAQGALPKITFVAGEDDAKPTPNASAPIVASLVERMGLAEVARELGMDKHHGVEIEHIILVFLLFASYQATSVKDLQEKAKQDQALADILDGVEEITDRVLRYYRTRHEEVTLESLMDRFVEGTQRVPRFQSKVDGVLALDDSTIEKFGKKKMDHIAVVYDHCEKRFHYGFVVVSTCYCDSDKLYPVNFQFRIQTEEERRRSEEARLKKEAGIDFRTKGALEEWLDVLKSNGRLPTTYSMTGKFVNVANFKELDERELHWVAMAHERLPLYNQDGDKAWDYGTLKKKTLANKAEVVEGDGLWFYTKEVTLKDYNPDVDFVVVTDIGGQEVATVVLQRLPHQQRVARILEFLEREGEPEATKLDIGVRLLERAKVNSHIKATTVAADSWFFVVWFVNLVLRIPGIKRMVSKLKVDQLVLYAGQWLQADQLWKLPNLRFRHERQKHFKWARLLVDIDGLGPVQLVLVQELDKKRPWRIIAQYIIVCTDCDFGALQVVSAYKLRWGIEVFYRAAKQRFGMTQFHDEKFAAIHFHMTFVFLSYLLTAALRQITPTLADKTIGQVIDLYLRALVRIKKKGKELIVFLGPRFVEAFGLPSLANSP
jgi:hypothetical protein